MKQILYLIRHGHTSGTETAIMYGATELPLTSDGLSEIAVLSGEGIYPDPEGAVIYTSGMVRALQTLAVMYGGEPVNVHVRLDDLYPRRGDNVERIAEYISELCALPHRVEPLLCEVNLGPYEMMTIDEVLEDDYGGKWIRGELEEPNFAGGDSHHGFRDRINRGLWKIVEEAREEGAEKIIIVTHGGVITYIMDEAFPGMYENKWEWCPRPGTGYEIELEDGVPVDWEPVGDIGFNETPVKDF